MNSSHFIGRMTADPEVNTSNGKSYCKFQIAVKRKHVKEGGQKADFPNITAFGKTAEALGKYVKKGHLVGVDCTFQSGNYTDKNGNKVYTAGFIANEIDFLEPKKNADAPATATQNEFAGEQFEPQEEMPAGFDAVQEDVPF